MTRHADTDRAQLPLGKRGAFEGVARRHGRRRNPAWMTPRSSLRTPTHQPRHSPQRWVEKCGRSIKGSDTPQIEQGAAGTTTPVPPPHRDADTRATAKLTGFKVITLTAIAYAMAIAACGSSVHLGGRLIGWPVPLQR